MVYNFTLRFERLRLGHMAGVPFRWRKHSPAFFTFGRAHIINTITTIDTSGVYLPSGLSNAMATYVINSVAVTNPIPASGDRKSTRLNSSHSAKSRMPSSA